MVSCVIIEISNNPIPHVYPFCVGLFRVFLFLLLLLLLFKNNFRKTSLPLIYECATSYFLNPSVGNAGSFFGNLEDVTFSSAVNYVAYGKAVNRRIALFIIPCQFLE